MTTHVRRDRKRGLTKVHEINANNQIVRTHVGKEAIEENIMNHNRQHYSQAKNAPVYRDEIYYQLQSNNVRDKILKG